MSTRNTLPPEEPAGTASREDWQRHLDVLTDLMAAGPLTVELLEADHRAHEAIRRIDYPNGYTRADRLRDRLAAEDY